MMRLKDVCTSVFFLSTLLMNNYAFAQDGSNDGGGGALFGLIVFFIIWAYPANKWRLWASGFRIGAADKDEFIDAMKWTVIGVVLTAIVIGIAAIFS